MSEPAGTDRIEAHVWRIAFVVVIGSIMSILDTTIVNVALETLGRELHSTIADIQWVITGYMLSLAAVIPVTGWAARRFGAKPRLPALARPLHRRLGALRLRDSLDRADRLPRHPGRRRRHDPAARPADDGDGRRAEADGPRDEHRRRPGDARRRSSARRSAA